MNNKEKRDLKKAEEQLIGIHTSLKKYVVGDVTKSYKYWRILNGLETAIQAVNEAQEAQE